MKPQNALDIIPDTTEQVRLIQRSLDIRLQSRAFTYVSGIAHQVERIPFPHTFVLLSSRT